MNSSSLDFVSHSDSLTEQVMKRLAAAGPNSAVIAEAPPGAGKSTLTVSVAKKLLSTDKKLKLAVVTQTNEQADDLVKSLVVHRELKVARLIGGSGLSSELESLAQHERILVGGQSDESGLHGAQVFVATARKWEYERSRLQKKGGYKQFPFALIDEAYQMRSDALMGIADLYQQLFCVGDPGQLDPFTTIDDSIWKGLPYSPSRPALSALRAYHPDLEPMQMEKSWRLPPSAAEIVSSAFYPYGRFVAGTPGGARSLELGKTAQVKPTTFKNVDAALNAAAASGWAYVELPERLTVRTDIEIAQTLAGLTHRLLQRGAHVSDERNPKGVQLTSQRLAVIAAHNDQVQAVRYALQAVGTDPNTVVISTANRIQGREYDVVFVWHPLAGRRDATSFHLEAGRMCVMLSRHRHACIVVGRAGAERLMEEFPDSEPVYLGRAREVS